MHGHLNVKLFLFIYLFIPQLSKIQADDISTLMHHAECQ